MAENRLSMDGFEELLRRETDEAIRCIRAGEAHADFRLDRPDCAGSVDFVTVLVRKYYDKLAVVVRIKLGGTGVPAFWAMLSRIWDDVQQALPESRPLIRSEPVWRDRADGDLRLGFFPLVALPKAP